MTYDHIFLGENITNETKRKIYEKYQKNILIIEHSTQMDQIKSYEQENNIMNGLVLEIKKCDEHIELNVMTQPTKVRNICTKYLHITSMSWLGSQNIISLYEILWAAKIQLHSDTLLPIISDEKQTSIYGVYYIA